MKEKIKLGGKGERDISPNILDLIEVRIFQNKTNHQYTLPVLKKHISPKIIKEIFDNKDVIGLKFKITDVILRNNIKENKYLKMLKRR